jgi:signal transduction histidine kinase/CheY-like chemotaxis protein
VTAASKWSIAQRLGVGFALLLLVLASFVGLIAWQLAQNDQASKTVDATIGATQRIDEFENAVLQLAVSTRDAMREQTPQHLEAFMLAQQRLDARAKALGENEGGPELAALAAQYISASQKAVPNAGSEGAGLPNLRQTLLDRARAVAELQDAAGDQALERMRNNRQAAAITLFAGALLTVVLFLVIAYLTTRSVSVPARELVGIAAAMRAGNWRPAQRLGEEEAEREAPSANEMAQIGRAFGTAATALELREQRLEAHAAIAQASGASLDGDQIAQAVLRIMLQQVQAEVGALYVADADTGKLVPVASRCIAGPLAPVRMGEGLVGQCAADRATLMWRDLPAESPFAVSLGAGPTPPGSVAAIPLVFGNKVLGVVVVASLRTVADTAITFLEAAAAQIAVGLTNAQAHQKVQQLFSQLQAQSERIQAQNEELQAQNEELQAQSEEIQAQHEELQAQTEEIQAQNEDLQRQTAQLYEQTGALKEADAQKNEFLGLLAHELRNPLTPIANCVGLLSHRSHDPHEVAKIENILGRQVRHMTHLIDDLLDVTRVSRGKVVLKNERLNLTELIRQCIGDQLTAIEQVGLELAVNLPEVPIYVEGDHTRICQVFTNLLGNAVKFCRPGSTVSVTVTLDPPRRQVSIHVADTGEGIEPALFSRIFEPFFQADSDLARTKGGLGLGLALAKGLVELHGGRIDVHSAGKGLGAEFIVTLPLAEAAAHGAGAHHAEAAHPKAREALAARVLVVDDNADAADSLALLLKLHGCEVEVAYAACNGIDAALRFHPDVILCDIGLPLMDGYAFAQEVQRHAALRDTLLIALTGYSLPADQQRATEAGFAMHLTKPPDHARILDIVRAHTGDAHRQRKREGSGSDRPHDPGTGEA